MTTDLYDKVPYVSEPYAESHPDLLYAIASSLGLAPPPVDAAAILELGSSAGNNLIPVAAYIPGTRCLGIDGSAQAVAAGNKTIAEVGLTNIELRHARFEEPGELGQFDYIVCHGVYSWIDLPSRTNLLRIVGSHLAPGGLAYLSFNTYPGWYQRLPVRDLMRWYNTAEQITDPRQQIAEGRLVAAAIAEQTDRRDGIYRQTMNHAASQFSAMPDWYLFHDYLEIDNHPVYLSTMLEEARAAGLGFVADVELNEATTQGFTAELARLDKLTGRSSPRSREEQEQFYDFLINRAFRRVILTRVSDLPSLRPAPGPFSRVVRHAMAAPGKPVVPGFVRYQAACGPEITNFHHESIELSPFAAEVVKRLDGTRTAQQVSDELLQAGAGVEGGPDKTFLEVVETIDLLLGLCVIAK